MGFMHDRTRGDHRRPRARGGAAPRGVPRAACGRPADRERTVEVVAAALFVIAAVAMAALFEAPRALDMPLAVGAHGRLCAGDARRVPRGLRLDGSVAARVRADALPASDGRRAAHRRRRAPPRAPPRLPQRRRPCRSSTAPHRGRLVLALAGGRSPRVRRDIARLGGLADLRRQLWRRNSPSTG